MSKVGENGAIHLLILVAALAGTAFLLFALTSPFETGVFSRLFLRLPSQAASETCDSPVNDIVRENCLPGTAQSVWESSVKEYTDQDGIKYKAKGSPYIQGYASKISYQRGETAELKIKLTKKRIDSSSATLPYGSANSRPDPNQSSFLEDAVNIPYNIKIYRLGYYGGKGARLVHSSQNLSSVDQPNCNFDSTTLNFDCGKWGVSYRWKIPRANEIANDPTQGLSGIYIAKITRSDTSESNHIIFVVREADDTTTPSDILFQTPDTTWQAYNSYPYYGEYIKATQVTVAGETKTMTKKEYIPGYSSYTAHGLSGTVGSQKVSYNRPFNNRLFGGGMGVARDSFLFGDTLPMIRFLEQNGYSVSYLTGWDTHRLPESMLLKHKVYLAVGHDEYWTLDQRRKVEAARDQGLNLGFFSGNAVYWKIRYENSIDGTNDQFKTLVAYKENCGKQDTSSSEWTGLWMDGIGCRDNNDPVSHQNSLIGTSFKVVPQIGPGEYSTKNQDRNPKGDALEVTAEDAKLRLWRNTNLSTTSTNILRRSILGFEWDEDIDNGTRPGGQFRLSDTYVRALAGAGEAGNPNPFPQEVRHNIVMYKKGGLVFGAGTIQWPWALNNQHDIADFELRDFTSPPDPVIQQATINLLADLGAQPGSLITDLKPAAKSTDFTPPSSQITSHPNNSSVQGTTITLSGTANDTGGTNPSGRVGGVEVSTDGGTTWHPAEGRENWNYTWKPADFGTFNIKSRATDDSTNIESPGSGINLTVSSTDPNTIISANPNPCNTPLNEYGTCTTYLSWSAPANYSQIYIEAVDLNNNQIIPLRKDINSFQDLKYPWINYKGVVFSMYEGDNTSTRKLLNSTTVKIGTYKGNIRTSPPGQCNLNGQSSCKVQLIWTTYDVYTKNPNIKAVVKTRETDAVLSTQLDGQLEVSNITPSGNNFDLYVDDNLYDSIFVKAQ